MGPEGGLRASEHLEHCHLTIVRLRVHDQAHPHRHPIMTKTQRLKSPQALQLKIKRIVIIAPAVAISKEGLAGIVGPHESQLHVVAIIELIAQPVAQGGTQIVVILLLEGYAGCRHQFMMSIPEDLLQTRERGLGCITHITDTRQQPATRLVERADHQEFALRLHRAIAIQVFHDLLDLLGREERQVLELGTCGRVEVKGVQGEFTELVIDILPHG